MFPNSSNKVLGEKFLEIQDRFSAEVRAEIKKQIRLAAGNEVFFVGKIDQNGVVIEAEACSRGTSDTVPVNISKSFEAAVLIHNHPSGLLYPSEADLAVAARCSERAQGFYIVNNEANDVYVVVEPILPKTIVKLPPESAAYFLSKIGPLAKIYSNYEERPSQIELVKKITDSFNNGSIGVFEAGTGVGKSFAYLVPSMIWAVENKERVVISTGTINLQQQLCEKDIPLAEKIIGKKIKAVLVKGRNNYVCLRRLNEVLKDMDLFSEDEETFTKINDWTKTTPTGSRSDLSFMPGEKVWQRVNSESDACMGMRCKYREQCFVMKVRKEAVDANILIVNHHLLFADIESRMNGAGYDDVAVLPPYKRVIFDEAHGIEGAATSFFSNSLNRFKILKQLNLLYRQKKTSVSGFLFTVSALSRGEDRTGQIEEEISKTKIAAEALDQAADSLLEKEFTLRVQPATAQKCAEVFSKLGEVQAHLGKVTGLMRKVMDEISDDDKDEGIVWETRSVLKRLDDIVALCGNFRVWDEHDGEVFWMQKYKLPESMTKEYQSPYYVQFSQTPLDIAPMMNSGVFEPFSSVVCVSATLGIGGKFDFWERRTGVTFSEPERVLRGEFKSPFDYARNMIFAVPSDAPFPDNDNFQSFVDAGCVRMIQAAGGRTLVLFTSFDSLRHACDVARTELRSTGITILKQGDDDRSKLLDSFKSDNTSVLFATESFWEGIDVPGDSLSQVIIAKLPFGVPSDPVFAARSDLIKSRGGNPFMELSVPESVIKFRQGFGRLIRRGDDRGAVVVFDRRIIEKRYGEIFMRSVPMTKRIYEPLENIARAVSDFI